MGEVTVNYCVNRIGNMKASQLKTLNLEKYRQSRLSEISVRKGRPVQPSTINRDVANFRAMLNKAVDYSLIESNPLGQINNLKKTMCVNVY